MNAGRIELVVGPMFAGKTTEMLRRVDRAELAHKRVAVMKYSNDNRYSENSVSTHDLKMRIAIPCKELLPHVEECSTYDVIGVDEGQFFKDVVEFSEKLANEGKTVIVAGLDGTFQRKPFGNILNLISRCESITKLSAVCTETGSDACFTQRTVESDQIELIGGAEMYRAASRSSFFHIQTKGEIHLTVGPVQSGKTTDLLRVLNRHKIAGRKVVVIRPNELGFEKNPSIKFSSIISAKLPSIDELKDFQVIGIDEGQRFNGIAEFADELANLGKLVEVSALDSDAEQHPYNNIIELFPLCEKIQKLDSICQFTGLPAPFSIILNGLKMVPISRFALLQNSFDQIKI